MTKQATLPEFLTQEQIDQAFEIYRKHKNSGHAVSLIETNVIKPNITEINRKLGQENDPTYLSYACTYVFGQLDQN